MRKSSFGQASRLSSVPLRVKNDAGGGSRKPSSGIHTPQGKRFSSGIPTSSSRARPGTSYGMNQRGPNLGAGMRGTGFNVNRNSSIGGRSSGIGTRVSGIGARSRTDVPKDPRPISDKSFQYACIRTLTEFLTENEYPHAFSAKLLQSPPAKEFYRIFEFIYRHLDPSFKLVSKMDEEVPRLLKSLGYPFNISRSSMQAVGTPHTWPHLLAALVWMVDLVKYAQRLNSTPLLDQLIFPPDNEEFDSTPDDKIKFQYMTQTYAAYMNGADEYDAYDEELAKVLEDKYLGQSGGVEAIRNENARIREEIELLDQEMGRVDKLQEQQEIMLLDEKKFRDYLSELDSVIRRHQQMLQDAEQEHASLSQEHQALVSKTQQMQAIYQQQDLTPADVEKLRADRLELQRQEESLEREVEAIHADIWKEEISLAKLLEQVDNSLAEYSKLARALRLIPSTTDVANGINFDLRSSIHELDNKFDTVIKPALMAMKQKGVDAVQQLQRKRVQEEERLEQMKDQLGDVQEEVEALNKDIRNKEQEYDSRKQLYQRDLEGLQATADRLQSEIRTTQASSQLSLQDLERELREVESWAEQQRREREAKEQKYTVFFSTVLKLVADQRERVQKQLEQFENDMEQVLTEEQQRTQRMEETSLQIRNTFNPLNH